MIEKGTYRIGVSLKEVNNALGLDLEEKDLEKILRQNSIMFRTVLPTEQLLISAKSTIGKPYKRGASVLFDAPEAFDCSSLVSWAAVESGYAIPRIAIDQYVYSQRIQSADLKPGDLVFANTKEIIHKEGLYFSKALNKIVKEEAIRTETLEYMPGTKVPEGVDHVGIYIGNNQIIHSSTKTGGAVIQNINESNSFKNIVGYGRITENEDKRFVIEIPHDRINMRTKEGLIREIKNLWQMKK
ncbi:MAG: C40 family peptidase [bacterium]|nr:C40 family peptidase [bacterium]